jgi:hypothetical protein
MKKLDKIDDHILSKFFKAYKEQAENTGLFGVNGSDFCIEISFLCTMFANYLFMKVIPY